MNSNPCRDCKEREVGCHGYCELYINWRKEYDKIKEKADTNRERQRIIESDYIRRKRK